MQHTAYIGLGANLGDAVHTVRLALQALHHLPDTAVVHSSALYRSAPVDASGDDYVNAVACLATSLTALELLRSLQQIENEHGRVRSYRNAPRTLDCDVLLFDQQHIRLPELTVPHPRMHLRAFVLVPLLEIAPDCVIPGLGRAADLLPQVANQSITALPIDIN